MVMLARPLVVVDVIAVVPGLAKKKQQRVEGLVLL